MRILVLQLARFGDIYQTWPTLRALARHYPACELHLLVRSRFRAATEGLVNLTVHEYATQDILAPILQDGDTARAAVELGSVLEPLLGLDFDLIINLSFSPLASYLTDFLAKPQSQIRGYTRDRDGHLRIPDDTSAYFYAQVGIDRANRYHVTDLFAAVAGVDLEQQDFCQASMHQRQGVVVHLGASTIQKTYPAELWVEVLGGLLQGTCESITLVGGQEETALARTVSAKFSDCRIVNQVGKTRLFESMKAIQQARLLIGADSAPIHMATLSGTPVLNLSSVGVNFWETGPLSPGSRILYADHLANLRSAVVIQEALSILNGRPPRHARAICEEWRTPYRLLESDQDDFAWRLISALYTDAAYPMLENCEDRAAFQRLFELSELSLKQLERWNESQISAASVKILQQVDILLPEVGRLCPRVEPVVQWFQTQRLRISPGPQAEILAETRKAFHDLYLVASVYHQASPLRTSLLTAIDLCQVCSDELREYGLHQVEVQFQTLVSTLQELSQHSSNVAGNPWPLVLQEINDALVARDYIHVADVLQWRLRPSFIERLNETETLSPDLVF